MRKDCLELGMEYRPPCSDPAEFIPKRLTGIGNVDLAALSHLLIDMRQGGFLDMLKMRSLG